MQVYKNYTQPRLDYGITLYGCSTQENIDLVQRVQNHATRLITGNFDYINCCGIDLVKSLNLYNIRDRRDYFLTIMMFEAIHGIAPTYLSDRIVINFDENGYDTRGSDMDLYLPTLRREAYRNSFMYMSGITTWKLHSVHGYGFLYFIRYGMKSHSILFMCYYFT